VNSRRFIHRTLRIIGYVMARLRPRQGLPPAPEPDRGDLLTLEEVAARIGVDVSVVRRAIAKGDIPAVRTAKDLRIERVALERTLAIAAANYRPPP
jgi:excisionase family DNA binding protein